MPGDACLDPDFTDEHGLKTDALKSNMLLFDYGLQSPLFYRSWLPVIGRIFEAIIGVFEEIVLKGREAAGP